MDKFAYWLQIIGNFAIVGGLVLVGVQISQNTLVTEAALTDSRFNSILSLDQSLLGEAPAETLARAQDAPESLSSVDIIILQRYFATILNNVLRSKRLGEMGVLPEDVWRRGFLGDDGQPTGGMMLRVFNNPPGRAWWRAVRDGLPEADAEMTRAMDELLASEASSTPQQFEVLFREYLSEEHAAAMRTRTPLEPRPD